MFKIYLIPSVLLGSIWITGVTQAQGMSPPLVIEQSSKVLGSGVETDLKPKALLELYQEARKSSMAVSIARSQGRTILLDQDYIVYPSDSNTPTRIKRKVVLNQSAHYGEIEDTECAVRILQEGSFDTSGRWLGASLTHQIEIPKCAVDRKSIETALINISEVKKDCATVRSEKVSTLYSSDAALRSMEAELVKQSSTAAAAITESAAKEISKYPVLSASLIELIANVYKTHQCPTSNIEGWSEFKNVSKNLYSQEEHKKNDFLKELLSERKSPLLVWI